MKQTRKNEKMIVQNAPYGNRNRADSGCAPSFSQAEQNEERRPEEVEVLFNCEGPKVRYSPRRTVDVCVVDIEQECGSDGRPIANDDTGKGQDPHRAKIENCRRKYAKGSSYVEVAQGYPAIILILLQQSAGYQVAAQCKKDGDADESSAYDCRVNMIIGRVGEDYQRDRDSPEAIQRRDISVFDS